MAEDDRLARALYEALNRQHGNTAPSWERLGDEVRAQYEVGAAAAHEAMAKFIQ